MLSKPSYRADIDGLRAVAVLSVVVFHAVPERLAGGFVGVDVFFVISGFLISTILFSNLEAGTFRFAEFYARRVRRIFPALALTLAATFVAGWIALLADEYASLGQHMAAGAGFASNLLLWRESGYFDATAETKPLLHLWSLGVEEQFYLLWPPILWLARRVKLPLGVVTAVLAVVSFGVGVWRLGVDPTEAFYSPLTRFWELLVGAQLAWLLLRRPDAASQLGRWGRHALSLVGLGLIVVAEWRFSKETPFPGARALLPTLGAALGIFAGEQALVQRWLLARRPLVWIGLFSFPLYLWHWPLLALARVIEGETPSLKIRGIAVAIAFALSVLTYLLVERPLRAGAALRAKTASLVVVVAGLGVLGFQTHAYGGFAQRPKVAAISRQLAEVEVPESTRISDGSCAPLGITMIGDDVCLMNSEAPEILIVGDSHAMALNSAPYLGLIELPTLLVASSGCPPLDGFTVLRRKRETNPECRDLSSTALRLATELPSIQTVFLVSRGPLYVTRKGYGAEGWSDRAIASLDGNNDVPQAEMFYRGYSATIGKLLEAGKRVVFVIDWPELGEDPHGCLFQRPFTLTKEKALSPCSQPKQAVLDRQKSYREIVKRLKQAHPKLAVYDSLRTFCDQDTCRGRIKSDLLYWDDDHLSPAGAKRLMRDLSNFIKR